MSTSGPSTASPEARPVRLAWLALAPAASALEVAMFPRAPITSVAVGVAIATAGAVTPALVALALASRARAGVLWLAGLALVGGVTMAALYARGVSSIVYLPLATFAIVAFSGGLGALVGSRVEHAGHVLPAAFVAAAADVASVMHPSGLSNAIARSDRALSVLAIGAPVPGSSGVAFALGAGDLTFAALLFAAAAVHGASIARTACAVALGATIALATSALSGRPIPALVPIGACAIAFVPVFREVRRRDRTVTRIAIALSAAAIVGVIVRAVLSD
jgi:hypothetical protein